MIFVFLHTLTTGEWTVNKITQHAAMGYEGEYKGNDFFEYLPPAPDIVVKREFGDRTFLICDTDDEIKRVGYVYPKSITAPPIITGYKYEADGDVVTAYIRDDFTSLDKLKISHQGIFSNHYEFDTTTGFFRGIVDSGRQELFSGHLKVADEEQNIANASFNARIPKAPPEIVLSYNPENEKDITKPRIIARIWDKESGIDEHLTTLHMNGEPKNDLFWNGEVLRYYSTAPLAEGAHTAEVSATDNVGLTSVKTVNFEIAAPPLIERFQYRPESRHNPNVPAITATIIDNTGIDESSITLVIDGEAVDRAKLVFHSQTGWLAWNPEKPFRSGGHKATLWVQDVAGNDSEAELDFTIAPESRVEGMPFSIGRVEVVDIRGNNNGVANEGERLFLYIELYNETKEEQKITSAIVRNDNPYIASLFEPVSAYSAISSEDSASNLRPFEIVVAAAIDRLAYEGTVDAPMTIHIATAQNPAGWDLPFNIPVHSLNPAFSTVTVSIDPVRSPVNETSQTITGRFESKGSKVELITATAGGRLYYAAVNEGGGTYSVNVPLSPGNNRIIIEAINRSGIRSTAETNITGTNSAPMLRFVEKDACEPIAGSDPAQTVCRFRGLYSPAGGSFRSFKAYVGGVEKPWLNSELNADGSWNGRLKFLCDPATYNIRFVVEDAFGNTASDETELFMGCGECGGC